MAMMNQPPIDQLLKRVSNRYSLVVAASRRARRILDLEPVYVDVDSQKPVTIALNEIGQGKLVCKEPPQRKKTG